MNTVIQHNERLTMEKAHLASVAEARLGLLGVVALQHGTKKKDGRVEYRFSKAAVNKIQGHGVNIRTLKSGAVVVEVRELEEGG